MWLLSYRNLRSRPARTILTALAIALGVGMILAARFVAAAVEQSTAQDRASRLAGADLEVTSSTQAYLNAGLAAEISARPEVEVAGPTYRRPEGRFDSTREMIPLSGSYPFTGTGLLLLGVDPPHLLSPYELAEGSLFFRTDAAEVLLPRTWARQQGFRVGDPISLTTAGQTRSYTVVGLLEPSPRELLSGVPTAWIPLATMQAAFETPGAATEILVRLKPGTRAEPARDALQADLGPLYIVTSAAGSAGGIRPIMVAIADLALPFAGLAVLLAGAFLVYNAFAITMSERRREIGQLRTLGMTRRQVLQQVLAEALLVALLGSVIGILLGLALGRGMAAVFVGILQGRPVPALSIPAGGVLLAVGAGIVVTLAVAWNLARRAGRTSPLEALRADNQQDYSGKRYARWGVVGALVMLALYFVASAAAARAMAEATHLDLVAVFVPPFFLAGVALAALPIGVNCILWLSGRICAHLGISPRLAVDNLGRQRGRAILTTATMAIGLMLVTTVAGITIFQKSFFRDNLLSIFQADFVLVHPSSFGTFETRVSLPSLPPHSRELQGDLDQLADEAEVFFVANIQVPGYGSGPLLDNGWALTLGLMRDSPAFRPVEGSWAQAEEIFDQGPAISLPEIAARRLSLHPGDTVQIDTFRGRVPFKVAFVGGVLPLVTREVGEHYFHSYPFLILINARSESDRPILENRLRALARKHALAFTADIRDEFGDAIDTMFDTVLNLFTGLTSITGLVAGLAIVNTEIATVLERRREIGVLRALGMTRNQVRRLVAVEAGLLGLIGAMIGTLGGLGMSLAFGQAVSAFGQTIALGAVTQGQLPWAVAGAAIAAGPTTAVLAALYPAGRAAAVDPAEAMRTEGA